MRLKVEHAEPGTDPTLIETPMRTQSGLAYAIKQNWWVVLGLAVVIFGLTRDKDAPKKQYTIGSQQRRCENEAWFLINEP